MAEKLVAASTAACLGQGGKIAVMKRLTCGVCTLIVLGIFGCRGDSPTNETPKSDTARIGMMPKLMGIAFFDAVGRGAQEAADELGIELLYDGPTVDSAEEQAEMINTWVAQGFDVVAVAPNDPDSIAATLSEAKSAGVRVLTWDTDANPELSGRTLFVNQAPSDQIAHTMIDIMIDEAGQDGKLQGKFLIVSGITTAANQNAWMEIMVPRLAREHPECELLETLYPGEDQRQAQVQIANALTAHADLKGIWAITSVALPAAAKALRDAGRADEVTVTGLSMPSLMGEYVKDGTISKFVLWDAVDQGYLTVHVAYRISQGPLNPGIYDMGRLKGIKVTDDEVILGPPLIFNRQNIDNFAF